MTQEIDNVASPLSESESSKIVDIFQQSYDDEHEPVGSQHLTFSLGEELYTVDILCVQEIRAWEEVTRIPNTEDYIKGVINLRGSILPVLDLRQYFGIENIKYLETTVVIVIAIEVGERDIQVGVVVDMVSDVIRFTEEEVNSPPQFGDDKKADFITGLVTAKISENVINFMEVMDSVEGEANKQSVDADNKEQTKKLADDTKQKKIKKDGGKECMVMLLDTVAIGVLVVGTNDLSSELDKVIEN